MNSVLARTFYIRIDEQRLCIDLPGAAGSFDESASMAIRDISTKQARIGAIGNAAESCKAQVQITVLRPFTRRTSHSLRSRAEGEARRWGS